MGNAVVVLDEAAQFLRVSQNGNDVDVTPIFFQILITFQKRCKVLKYFLILVWVC
jgi:hypothetical protein